MAGFRINYGQVVGQANKIDDLSSDLDREIQKLDSILNSVRSNWKGPASTAYQKHLKTLISDMKETRRSMVNVSSTIKNVVRRVQKEDEHQAELARQLVGVNIPKGTK